MLYNNAQITYKSISGYWYNYSPAPWSTGWEEGSTVLQSRCFFNPQTNSRIPSFNKRTKSMFSKVKKIQMIKWTANWGWRPLNEDLSSLRRLWGWKLSYPEHELEQGSRFWTRWFVWKRGAQGILVRWEERGGRRAAGRGKELRVSLLWGACPPPAPGTGCLPPAILRAGRPWACSKYFIFAKSTVK